MCYFQVNIDVGAQIKKKIKNTHAYRNINIDKSMN